MDMDNKTRRERGLETLEHLECIIERKLVNISIDVLAPEDHLSSVAYT